MVTGGPLALLMIEDCETDADLVTEALAGIDSITVKIDWRTRISEGVKRLKEGGVDLVLLDLSLPDGFALDSLSRVQEAAPTVPIVVLTGLDDKETAIEAVQRGAQDYLVKGLLEREALSRSIHFAIERKHSEELSRLKLKAHNTLLKNAIEFAPLGVAQLSNDLTIIEANQTFEQLFAINRDTVVGANVTDIIDNLPEAEVRRALAFYQVSQVTGFRVKQCGVQANEERYFDLSIWPCKGNDFDEVQVVLVAENVTDRVNHIREREDFIYTLAHDLKVPFIGATKAVQILQQCKSGCICDAHQELVDALVRNNQDLLNMLQNLVDFHQLEMRDDRVMILTNPAALLKNAVADLAGQAQDKKIKLSVDICDSLPAMTLDYYSIQRVIWNLLHNAIKFTPSYGEITVSAEVRLQHLIIQVRDTGCGICPDDQINIFKRFWRAKSIERHSSGNGLGLYLCRRMIHKNYGRISCKSKVGCGSTFTVVLPSNHSGITH